MNVNMSVNPALAREMLCPRYDIIKTAGEARAREILPYLQYRSCDLRAPAPRLHRTGMRHRAGLPARALA